MATQVSRVYEINTDGTEYTTNSDGLHFNAPGQVTLGTAFAQVAETTLPIPEPGTRGAVALGLALLAVAR